jgi:hypothetical protein
MNCMTLILLADGKNTDNWRARKGVYHNFLSSFSMASTHSTSTLDESVHFGNPKLIVTEDNDLRLTASALTGDSPTPITRDR